MPIPPFRHFSCYFGLANPLARAALAGADTAECQCTGSRYAQRVSQTPFRVVIAEDEALIRLDLKEMLEEDGYVVVGEASDGEAAVKLTESLRPDLVIMDIKMPGLDGISAAERITAEHMAPVVILTAFSQRDLVLRARDAGAMAFLVKPFTKADLVPAIEIAVSRFQEFAALESEVSNLKERLEVRKLLDRAKGMLQAEQGMTEAEAFRWIQKSSMDRRMTMRAVAEEVLQGAQPSEPKAAEGQNRESGGARPGARESGEAEPGAPGKAAGGAGGSETGTGKTGRGKTGADGTGGSQASPNDTGRK
jgi:AmiR/NasT family two-component response regulator